MMTRKTTIRLMPEVQCWPLWDEDGNSLDPCLLGLSDDLVKHLNELAEAYDAPMNWDDPRETHWPEEERKDFEARLVEAAGRLRSELGGEASVEVRMPWPSK